MFPKILHFMWLQGADAAPRDRAHVPGMWGSLNPEYQVMFWDKDDVEQLLIEHYPDWLGYWRALSGKTELSGVIKQADLARLFVTHRFGGIYLDMDLEPQTKLDDFFSDPYLYNYYVKMSRYIPEEPSRDSCDKSKYEIMFSREHCMIDGAGRGVANGVIIAKAETGFLMDFATNQRGCHNGLVLDFVGTWALTRFIRSRMERLRGKVKVIPPHYFLWEPHYFRSPMPSYTVSVHHCQNTWGDHSKKHWWLV